MGIDRRARALAAALVLAAAVPEPAHAGEFYGAMELAITEVRAHASGNNGVISPAANHGNSTDTSPLIAGLVGFEFRMHELLPRRRRAPAWMPDVDLEDWVLRTEIEAAGAREYDLSVDNDTTFPHRATVEDITLLFNQWLDLPLGHTVEAIAGRGIRGIDDLTLNLGLGIGYVYKRLETANGVSQGKKIDHHMAWQAGIGLGYPLTDNIVLTGGYRYVALGNHQTKLRDVGTGTQNNGVLKLDLDSHEFRAGLRVHFYSVRFPRGLFEPRRRYAP